MLSWRRNYVTRGRVCEPEMSRHCGSRAAAVARAAVQLRLRSWPREFGGAAAAAAAAPGGASCGSMGRKKTELPDRWTDYLPLGKRIPGTRFIAFKVPLKKSFEWRLAPNERFSPLDLLNQVREQQEELGLIIDLTYTTRYYEPKELPDTLQYCKILTVGHEVPDSETVFKFKSAVKKFLMENQDNDKLVGVHCTHGLNRTGYLVCRYLIDVEGMDPNVAIEMFNRCRGHSIERRNYLEDLRRGSNRRNGHHASASGHGWIQGPFGPAPHRGVQVTDYNPQSLQRLPLRAPRRRHHTQNPNHITCSDNHQSGYSPQYPPRASTVQQRWDYDVTPSHRPLYPPYQQHLQAYEGPYFPGQNPHYPCQQGKYKIDRRGQDHY
ncbi:RNA/RNP complex-1-interacting phosphatase [Hemicordylus capensis]|uniref:RNA/RNP complex-1-interacting phosphatase n=1 Tax=Hemicordylus capensis TaxID=884348 RepID=UPI0023021706|nr:RNA/RNP complex-1-interacting phosphatase [Hemicordylus capensis]